MDRYNGWFAAGERAWHQPRPDGEMRGPAIVAPMDQQTDTIGEITLMTSGGGRVDVTIDGVYRDVPEIGAYRAALREEKASERKTREFMRREGFVWGGKACTATMEWAAYAAAEERLSDAYLALREADRAVGRANQERSGASARRGGPYG